MNDTRATKFRLLLCVGFLSFVGFGSASTMVQLQDYSSLVGVRANNPFGFVQAPNQYCDINLNFLLPVTAESILSEIEQGGTFSMLTTGNGSITGNNVTQNFDGSVSISATRSGLPYQLNDAVCFSAGISNGVDYIHLSFYAPFQSFISDIAQNTSMQFFAGYANLSSGYSDLETLGVSYQSVPDSASSCTLLISSLVALGFMSRFRKLRQA